MFAGLLREGHTHVLNFTGCQQHICLQHTVLKCVVGAAAHRLQVIHRELAGVSREHSPSDLWVDLTFPNQVYRVSFAFGPGQVVGKLEISVLPRFLSPIAVNEHGIL